MTVKIMNMSQRSFGLEEDSAFGPKDVISVSIARGKELVTMYPGEIVNIEDYTKKMVDSAKTIAATDVKLVAEDTAPAAAKTEDGQQAPESPAARRAREKLEAEITKEKVATAPTL